MFKSSLTGVLQPESFYGQKTFIRFIVHKKINLFAMDKRVLTMENLFFE